MSFTAISHIRLLNLCLIWGCLATLVVTAVTPTDEEHIAARLEECMSNDITGANRRRRSSLAAAASAAWHGDDNNNNGVGSDQAQSRDRQRYFSMHFGDAGVETFSVVSAKDARQINDLADCVARLGSDLLLPRPTNEEIPELSFHGGSNVTYLTGVFQQVLPHVHLSILKAAASAVRKVSDDWPPLDGRAPSSSSSSRGRGPDNIWELGVRSVQYVSFNAGDLGGYREQVKKKVEEVKHKKNMFVIYPSEEERKQQEAAAAEKAQLSDPDTDRALQRRVRQGELVGSTPDSDIAGTVLTAVVMLSDRSEYAGGDILALRQQVPLLRRHYSLTRSRDQSGGDSGDGFDATEDGWEEEAASPDDGYGRDREDENYFDQDEDWAEADRHHHDTTDSSAAGATDATTSATSPYSQLSRFTPERGSLLLVHGAFGFGTADVRHGQRRALVLELWHGPDAPIGTARADLSMKNLLANSAVSSNKSEL